MIAKHLRSRTNTCLENVIEVDEKNIVKIEGENGNSMFSVFNH